MLKLWQCRFLLYITMKVYISFRALFISNKGYTQAVVEWKMGSTDVRHNVILNVNT